MRILVDTHTHTNCSSHAYSTLIENVREGKKRGLEMICMTNHTPALPDSPHLWHFRNMRGLPSEIEGVKVLYGAEANIIDKKGNIDLPIAEQKMMQVMIASIHPPCYLSGSIEEHTATYIGAIKNPYITIIGHSGSPRFSYDIDAVVRAAKEYNKCIEINAHSYTARPENAENCRRIAAACKRLGAKIVVASDAHNAFEVGVFDKATEMLCDIDFPEELIANLNAKRFESYLKSRL